MPRAARIKHEEAIYHIMVRSISEIDLFRDSEDKIKYLSIIRKCQLKYRFAIYAYCLMDNHGHLIVDSLGGDISRIMHYINFCYAQYYNRKYKRHGHVFQDRFKSKVIDNKRYMVTVSAYIHNNPKDITKYKENVQNYPFSSLKEYINKTNTFGILKRSFFESLLGFEHEESRKAYLKLIKISDEKIMESSIEFVDIKTEYQSHRKIISRYYTPSQIIQYVSNFLNLDTKNIYLKYRPEYIKLRALSCFLMNVFCNMTQKEICEVIGNVTQSGVSYLSSKGLEYTLQEGRVLEKFIA